MGKPKQVFHHYSKWEEGTSGMWRRPIGSERDFFIQKSLELMTDTAAFHDGMVRAIREWPISCEHNFTNHAKNRQAWLGHAACCIVAGSPEEPTRAAWWRLTQKQRDDADAAALAVIEAWQRSYLGEEPCQENLLGLMF